MELSMCNITIESLLATLQRSRSTVVDESSRGIPKFYSDVWVMTPRGLRLVRADADSPQT